MKHIQPSTASTTQCLPALDLIVYFKVMRTPTAKFEKIMLGRKKNKKKSGLGASPKKVAANFR